MNEGLLDYVKKSREAGRSDEQIKESLLAVGWDGGEVDRTFAQLLQSLNERGQNAAITEEKISLPRWLSTTFKIYGLLLILRVIYDRFIDSFAAIVLGQAFVQEPITPIFLISFSFSLISFSIVPVAVGFSVYRMYKFAIPLLGLFVFWGAMFIGRASFLPGIFYYFTSDYYYFYPAEIVLGAVIFTLALLYRRGLNSSFFSKKAYIAYGLFGVGLLLPSLLYNF